MTNPVDEAVGPILQLMAATLRHLGGDATTAPEFMQGFLDGLAAAVGAVVVHPVNVPQTAGDSVEHGRAVFRAWYDLHVGSPDQREPTA